MNAHVIPVCYLRGFSTDSDKRVRDRRVWLITRDRLEHVKLDDACCLPDYYTSDSAADHALFRKQEEVLGRLCDVANGVRAVPDSVHGHLWLLKARSRVMLDLAHRRKALVAAAKRPILRQRLFAVVRAEADLVTCDDPVVLYGEQRKPNETSHAFLVPISPRVLIVSAPVDYFIVTASTATKADVELLNSWQCANARDCVIAHADNVVDPAWARSHMKPEPWLSRSGVVPQVDMPPPPRGGISGGPLKIRPVALFNYTSMSEHSEQNRLSFLAVR